MKPPAERTSQTVLNQAKWDRIATSAPFRDLLERKKSFIIPAFLFFLAYYFLLSILVGYAPKLMSIRVIGTVTLAYLFAVSQFVVGWIIAGFYLKASEKLDRQIEDLLMKVDDPEGGE
jgi:uncharacterized membrane protein (DUF485 family)